MNNRLQKVIAFLLVLLTVSGFLPMEAGAQTEPRQQEGTEPAHTHAYEQKITIAATCETAGVLTFACGCGDAYSEEIAATGHRFTDGVCACGAAEHPDFARVKDLIADLPVRIDTDGQYDAVSEMLEQIDRIAEADTFPAALYQVLDWNKVKAAYDALDAYDQIRRINALFGAVTAFEALSAKPEGHMLEEDMLHVHNAADVSELTNFFETITDGNDPVVVPGIKKVKWSELQPTAAESAQWQLKTPDGESVERIAESGIYRLECAVRNKGKTYNFVAAEDLTVMVFDVLTVRTSVSDGTCTEAYGRVYRGNSVTVEAAEKENYTVSISGPVSANAAGTYTVGNLTGDSVLEISYAKHVDSTVKVIGVNITATCKAALTPGETTDILITPAAGFYISEVTINTGALSIGTFDANGAYHTSLTAGDTGTDYVVTVITAPVLTASGGDIAHNPYMTADQIIASIFARVDQAASVPGIDVKDIAVRFAYLDVYDTLWLDLDSSNVDKFGKTYEKTISDVAVKVVYQGGSDNRYPGAAFEDAQSMTVHLVENRPAAPEFYAASVSKADTDGIRAAAANAVEELELAADRFEVPSDWRRALDAIEVGETAVIPAAAQFDGNEIYRDGMITVYVTVTKSPPVPARLTLSADAEMGTVTIRNSNGEITDLECIYADGQELTIAVEPNGGPDFACYVQQILVTENGEQILATAEGENTAAFSIRNSDVFSYTYAVTVTYGCNRLTGKEKTDVKFNKFSGATVESQLDGGMYFADVSQQESLEAEILGALEVCFNGEPLRFSDGVSIAYDPWYQDGNTKDFDHGGGMAALAARPAERTGYTGFAFAASGRTETVFISYRGLSWTAQIDLVEGRPELELDGGTYGTVVMIDSADDRSTVEEAALSTVTGSKPDTAPHFSFANTENLNKTVPTDVQVSIYYDATADYLDDTPAVVTVPVQIREQPSAVTITENKERGSGTAAVFNETGEKVTAACTGILTVRIEPDGDGSYVAGCVVTDQSGEEVPVNGLFSNTVYEGRFAVTGDNDYTVAVTYGKRTLTAVRNTLNYNRFYEGKVTLQVNAVKEALTEGVFEATEEKPTPEELEVYVWHDDTGKYHNIDGTCGDEQSENMADTAFAGDSVRLRIVWTGSDRYPQVALQDLDVALHETRPAISPVTKTYEEAYPAEAPVPLCTDEAENRNRIKEKALGMVTAQANMMPAAPPACLYAVDITQAGAQIVFEESFTVPDDGQVHTVAVKITWDSTDTYIGTSVVVSVPAIYPREQSGLCELAMDPAESDAIAPGAVVYVDGSPYVLDENCAAQIEPDAVKDPVFVTAYRFKEAENKYKAYPTGMHVWYAVPIDEDSNGRPDTLHVERVTALDDFFRYEGTSIRLNRFSTGIRFFSSVHRDDCEKLMQGALLTGGLKDYRMVQAGTVFGKHDEDATVTLKNGTCSDVYGGRAGQQFRVFSQDGDRDLFTGILSGLNTNAATVNTELASRPYAVLEYHGRTLTLYGGQVCRSVRSVAVQNRDHFPSGSVSGELLERLISAKSES